MARAFSGGFALANGSGRLKYVDGMDLVVFEEFGAGEEALHLADARERDTLLQDESYRRRFRRAYDRKFGPASGTGIFMTPPLWRFPNPRWSKEQCDCDAQESIRSMRFWILWFDSGVGC